MRRRHDRYLWFSLLRTIEQDFVFRSKWRRLRANVYQYLQWMCWFSSRCFIKLISKEARLWNFTCAPYNKAKGVRLEVHKYKVTGPIKWGPHPLILQRQAMGVFLCDIRSPVWIKYISFQFPAQMDLVSQKFISLAFWHDQIKYCGIHFTIIW